MKVLPRHRRQYDRTLTFRLPYIAVQCHVVKSRAVLCHCEVCSAAVGHFGACRKSWVCLQHRASVVNLMVLQYIAANFHLPSVSTANINTMQHPQPHKQCEIQKNPSSCDIQGTASSVQHHGHLCSQPQQFLLLYLSSPANIQQS
jgi:hypothetical protein